MQFNQLDGADADGDIAGAARLVRNGYLGPNQYDELRQARSGRDGPLWDQPETTLGPLLGRSELGSANTPPTHRQRATNEMCDTLGRYRAADLGDRT